MHLRFSCTYKISDSTVFYIWGMSTVNTLCSWWRGHKEHYEQTDGNLNVGFENLAKKRINLCQQSNTFQSLVRLVITSLILLWARV